MYIVGLLLTSIICKLLWRQRIVYKKDRGVTFHSRDRSLQWYVSIPIKLWGLHPQDFDANLKGAAGEFTIVELAEFVVLLTTMCERSYASTILILHQFESILCSVKTIYSLAVHRRPCYDYGTFRTGGSLLNSRPNKCHFPREQWRMPPNS